MPFSESALAPHISEETMRYHYEKHHNAYVANLNKLIAGTEFESMPLVQICVSANGPVFNNAAQHWNHSFYWQCLSPKAGKPSGFLRESLDRGFGSLVRFKEQFIATAMSNFGSGWTWLTKSNNRMSIINTGNAEAPIKEGTRPLLTCDVWEHAYYIDYRDTRAAYLEAFWNVINWKFVEKQFAMT